MTFLQEFRSTPLQCLFQYFFLEKQHHLQAKKDHIPISLVRKDLKMTSQYLDFFLSDPRLQNLNIQKKSQGCTQKKTQTRGKGHSLLVLNLLLFQNSSCSWAQTKIINLISGFPINRNKCVKSVNNQGMLYKGAYTWRLYNNNLSNYHYHYH